MTGKEKASLYFHIPFCSRKCPYCHFYVLPDKELYKTQLLEALALEWEQVSPRLNGKRIVSIYFGGGTPTLFGPEAIGKVLKWIDRTPDCEITLEANPETTSFEEFAAIGINRLSIGVQSLDDSSLQTLERQHTAKAAVDAVEKGFAAGIKNISIDLMYDLPGQTFSSWENTLHRLKDLPIVHLSLYNLTIEPHTVFYKRQKALKPLLPSPETSLAMLEAAVEHLEKIGLRRYEISAFAKPGFESRHNSGYWTGRPFLGLGPSAFSYWEGKRFRNMANLSRYAQALKNGASPVDFEEQLAYPANIAELLAVRLRLLEGAEADNLPPEMWQTLEMLEKKGWLEIKKPRIRLTDAGRLFYDSVAEEIILDCTEPNRGY